MTKKGEFVNLNAFIAVTVQRCLLCFIMIIVRIFSNPNDYVSLSQPEGVCISWNDVDFQHSKLWNTYGKT